MYKIEKNEFEIISGTNNIILVAPHGYKGDDDNTGQLTRLLAERLNCYAIINEMYRKTSWTVIKGTRVKDPVDLFCNEVDLNSALQIEQAGLEKKWLGTIEKFKEDILTTHSKCLVFFIHGTKDKNVEKIDDQADVLLGVGRVKPDSEKDDRPTANDETVNKLIKFLKNEGSITAVVARAAKKEKDDIENRYAGWDRTNLNQLFTARNKKYTDKRVGSIQLEFKYDGFRDTPENIEATAGKLTLAISKLTGVDVQLPEIIEVTEEAVILPQPVEINPDGDLVEAAYSELKNIFVKHYEKARYKAMRDAGRYIVRTFYDDDYRLAKDKKKAVKKKTLNQLIKKLQGNSNDAPSKTWVYDAVGLAVDEHELKSFRTYGKISVSHKLKLLPVKDVEIKKQLVTETIDKNLSVRELSAKIKKINGNKPELKNLIRYPGKLFSGDNGKCCSDESLSALKPGERAEIKKRISKETLKLQNYLDQYGTLLERLVETSVLDN